MNDKQMRVGEKIIDMQGEYKLTLGEWKELFDVLIISAVGAIIVEKEGG